MAEKVDIIVKRPKRRGKRGAGAVGNKGPLWQRRGLHEVARRRVAKPGINFYDMSQVSNGSGGWIDTNEQFLTTAIVGTALVQSVLESSMFTTRDANLFSIPTADWKSKFRKLTKGSLSTKYAVEADFGPFADLLDNLSQWTAGGLVVTQADLNTGLSVSTPNVKFFDFVTFLDGVPNRKITGTNDYTGAPIAFIPGPLMDIFLPPKFIKLIGNSQVVAGGFQDQQLYSFDILTFPRHFIINTSDVYQAGSASGGINGVPTTLIDATINAAINNWKSIVLGRDFHYDDGSNTWTIGGTFNPGIGAGYAAIGTDNPGGPGDSNINGALLAVVKKGSSFYYFWTDGY